MGSPSVPHSSLEPVSIRAARRRRHLPGNHIARVSPAAQERHLAPISEGSHDRAYPTLCSEPARPGGADRGRAGPHRHPPGDDQQGPQRVGQDALFERLARLAQLLEPLGAVPRRLAPTSSYFPAQKACFRKTAQESLAAHPKTTRPASSPPAGEWE
jgi:hypothetical protein